MTNRGGVVYLKIKIRRESKSNNWVWRCTEESIEKQQVSTAACIEIAWSVALYWAIWYRFDTHLHLISSLIAAPLLLMRSPESIQKGG